MSVEESIQQIETLIEAWQLDEADLNQTDINAMQALLKENQKLKKKYENAVADYETTMAEKEQLNSLVNSCQKEIRQLKKQLENYKKLGFKHLQDKNNNLETQQKEFIKWLEDNYESTQDIWYIKILQKYKEINHIPDYGKKVGDDK